MSTDQKATISFTDGTPSIDLPILKGSVGPDVIDIRKLYGATGKFTYDPGFLSTASCQSTITYIDGDKGELLYRLSHPGISRALRLSRGLLFVVLRRTAHACAESRVRGPGDASHDGA